MKEVKLVDSAKLDFNLRGETPDGTAYVARAVGADVSPNMGIGFARWEGAEVTWKLLYDEVIFVIEGCFEMLWIPEGTELIYGGHALFGYVVHPGNWKELHGLA